MIECIQTKFNKSPFINIEETLSVKRKVAMRIIGVHWTKLNTIQSKATAFGGILKRGGNESRIRHSDNRLEEDICNVTEKAQRDSSRSIHLGRVRPSDRLPGDRYNPNSSD